MPLLPADALATIRAASDDAMVDTCALSVPATGGTYDPATNTTTGGTPGASYSGPCSLHEGAPDLSMRSARTSSAAEGSLLAEAEAWVRLPTIGEGLPAATFVAFRNRTSDLTGTVTHEGVTQAVQAKGIEKRRTHTRLYVRFVGEASA